MRSLPHPTDRNALPFKASEVFATCVSMVRSKALKAQLKAVSSDVEAAALDYDTKGSVSELFQIQAHNDVRGIPGSEMVKVYTGRMVAKDSTGRPIYDQIMSLPPHQRCPSCGVHTVSTLDHYLPKTEFPIFSVTPSNLIPACTWCQGEKMDFYAKNRDDQLLHPYFDDFDGEQWLAAEVIQTSPATFRFYSSPPSYWSSTTKARLLSHLKEFNLTSLFKSNAGSRLSEICTRLTNLSKKGGESAVREHLVEEFESAEADHKNSWVTAMYRAASQSDWFCREGFKCPD